jgi:hypothetical protein
MAQKKTAAKKGLTVKKAAQAKKVVVVKKAVSQKAAAPAFMPVPAAPVSTTSVEERIRARANQIWLSRQGDALSDWLTAEREILWNTNK